MVGTLGPGVGYGKASRFMYIATAGQITFNGADSSAQALTLGYTPNYVEVIVNGVWLPPQDYTATNGSSIVLGSGCVAGDIVYVYALSAFQLNLTPFPSPGALWGLTMSTAGASTTLSVAKGSAADSTNTTMMQLLATMAKTTSAWASGTGNGGLDTGTIAINTWYHWFLIFNPTTLAVDVVFSATATPANGPTTPPSGYTLFRRIGSMRTNASSQWVLFTQLGDEFIWDVPFIDVSGSGLAATATLFSMNTPPGISVLGRFRYECTTTSGTMGFEAWSPLVSNQSGGGGTWLAVFTNVGAGTGEFQVWTNTSSQIKAISNASGGTQSTSIGTHSWLDLRGKAA